MVRIFASFHVQVWTAPDGAPLRVRVVDVQSGAVRELDREQAAGVMEALRSGESRAATRLGAEGDHADERPGPPADSSTIASG
jgi:hypothetical protein